MCITRGMFQILKQLPNFVISYSNTFMNCPHLSPPNLTIKYDSTLVNVSDVVDDPTLFHWLDYVTFSLSVLLSVAVGFYYAFIHKSQTTKEEFLLGDRGMAVGPVSVSLFLGWFSSISFLGDPVEVYYYGALHWVFAFAYPLGLIPAALYFAPRFHDMNIISCFEVGVTST